MMNASEEVTVAKVMYLDRKRQAYTVDVDDIRFDDKSLKDHVDFTDEDDFTKDHTYYVKWRVCEANCQEVHKHWAYWPARILCLAGDEEALAKKKVRFPTVSFDEEQLSPISSGLSQSTVNSQDDRDDEGEYSDWLEANSTDAVEEDSDDEPRINSALLRRKQLVEAKKEVLRKRSLAHLAASKEKKRVKKSNVGGTSVGGDDTIGIIDDENVQVNNNNNNNNQQNQGGIAQQEPGAAGGLESHLRNSAVNQNSSANQDIGNGQQVTAQVNNSNNNSNQPNQADIARQEARVEGGVERQLGNFDVLDYNADNQGANAPQPIPLEIVQQQQPMAPAPRDVDLAPLPRIRRITYPVENGKYVINENLSIPVEVYNEMRLRTFANRNMFRRDCIGLCWTDQELAVRGLKVGRIKKAIIGKRPLTPSKIDVIHTMVCTWLKDEKGIELSQKLKDKEMKALRKCLREVTNIKRALVFPELVERERPLQNRNNQEADGEN